jgi:hypothetical protein
MHKTLSAVVSCAIDIGKALGSLGKAPSRLWSIVLYEWGTG